MGSPTQPTSPTRELKLPPKKGANTDVASAATSAVAAKAPQSHTHIRPIYPPSSGVHFLSPPFSIWRRRSSLSLYSIAMESPPSGSPSSLTFKSKKSHIFTTSTPQKPPVSPSVAIITPDRSDPLPRIRNQNFATKVRKLSLAGSDLLDLDRTTEKLPTSEEETQKIKSFDESATLLPEKYECRFLLVVILLCLIVSLLLFYPILTNFLISNFFF